MLYLIKSIKQTYVDHPRSFHVKPGQVLIFHNGRHCEVVEIINSTRCRVRRFVDFFRYLEFYVIELWLKIKKVYGFK